MGNITFTNTQSASSFQGSISNFQNPDSTLSLFTIQINLYSSANVLKASTSSGALNNFVATVNSGSITSSSTLVGDTNAILSVSVIPGTKLKNQGIVIITVPQYYQNSGGNQMIGSNAPTCTGTNGITVNSCTFVSSSRQITIIYTAGADITTATTLTINNFKNPISPQPVSGFTVLTQDSLGNSIGYDSSLTLSGITVPTAFSANQVQIQGTTSIGEYTTLKLTLSIPVPVQQNCYVKFIFPTDFTIDTQLVSLDGGGFFTASVTSSQIPWISINTGIIQLLNNTLIIVTQTVIVEACQVYYGTGQVGYITFYQIKNPGYVKGTGTIQVYLAADQNFQYIISQVKTGFTVSASQFQPGSIENIQVQAVNSQQVQTITSYQFTMTPVHAMNPSGAVIVFQFPTLITLSTHCAVVAKSSSFDSPNIACTISGQTISVTSPFLMTYGGSTQLQITLANGTNPISIRDAGTFYITTYINVGGSLYIVDSGSCSNQITPTGGWIHKGADIIASNYQTYQAGSAFQFYLQCQHSIPPNGIIRVMLPSQITISSKSVVQTSCKQFNTQKTLTCNVASSGTEIDVIVDSGLFPNGFPSSQVFQLYIGGFLNPRTTQTTDVFYFYSTDSSGYSIDQSTSSDYFNVAMINMGSILAVSASILSSINGNTTTYTITFVPNTPLYAYDQFQIQFPPQVTLPISTMLSCSPTSTTMVESLQCSLINTNLLIVTLTAVISIVPNTQISFNVFNVKNPISTTPTSYFSNILIKTQTGYFISQYTQNNVQVTTTTAGTITTGALVQSNQNPRQNAMYSITFNTLNPMPPSASILVITPSSITLNITNQTCYVQTTSVQNNVCFTSQGLIQIEGAFIHNAVNYVGVISIIFQAINPQSNSNQASIIVRSYTDNSFQYRIDKIESGLIPTLFCNYPCQTCAQTNPSFCTSCFTDDYTLPSFIQQYPNGTQTCSYSCLPGYTSNGSKNPKTCINCDQRCSICAETGSTNDYKTCITCSPWFPLAYSPLNTCWDSCTNGTYQCSQTSCCNCNQPCQNCISDKQCSSCYPQSTTSLYLMQSQQCVSSCNSGLTPVGNQCVTCNSPCGTCEQGLPNSCLTCDGLTPQQFLFGRECVAQCPNGTTLNYDLRICQGCMSQCTKCNDNNNAICLGCISGLFLYNNSCISQCPYNYIKSSDGTTCQIKPYLLDGSLIYFPFATAAGVIIFINIMSFSITCGKSLLLTNTIALLSLVEIATVAMVFYESYQKGYILIQFGAAGILGLQILLNTAFLMYYCCRLQFQDVTFMYWRQKFSFSVILVVIIASVINFKLFRLVYGRLFGLSNFSGVIEAHQSFFKPIIAFSMISLITFTAPVCVLGSIVIYQLTWGTQLYMTVIEGCGVALISGILMLFEFCPCCCCNWYAPREKKIKIVKAKDYNKIQDVSSFIQDQEDDKNKLKQQDEQEIKLDKERRKEVLKNILQTVKNNKDLKLNSQLDQLMLDQHNADDKDDLQLRRINSSKDLQMYKYNDQFEHGEDERKILTEPNSPIKFNNNNDDGTNNNGNTTLWIDQMNLKDNEKIKYIKKTIENMQTEFKFDNVFAEVAQPKPISIINNERPVVQSQDMEIQTEGQGGDRKSDKSSTKSINSTSPKSKKKALDDRQAQDSIEQVEEGGTNSRKNKKKNIQRGKKSTAYYTQIDEEDEEDNFSGGEDQNNIMYKTSSDHQQQQQQQLQLGVIVEDEENDIINIKSNGPRSVNSQQLQQQQQQQQDYSKEYNQMQLVQEQMSLLDEIPTERVMQDQHLGQEYFNQRNFNINDICGEFIRDSKGRIKKRLETLRRSKFKDLQRKDCNEMGYLIDKFSGDIINKYTFNRMFRFQDLIDESEIPTLFQIEANNFNPHEIFGNFDYQGEKPVILKTKHGQLVDKNLRNVNQSGYMVDMKGNIIDNLGRIKFLQQNLTENGDLPKHYNYKGKSYNIRDIVGTFKKQNQTKEIILEEKVMKNNKKQKIIVDKNGKQVNQKGYLVDSFGNIINKEGKIVFRKPTLKFNEPPKFFRFTHFDIAWVLGNLPVGQYGQQIVEFSAYHGGYRDLEGRVINSVGYLIDEEGNIIDYTGKIIFQNEILEEVKNQRVEIPKVFRVGIFRKIQYNQDQQQQQEQEEEDEGEQQQQQQFEENKINQQQDKDFQLQQEQFRMSPAKDKLSQFSPLKKQDQNKQSPSPFKIASSTTVNNIQQQSYQQEEEQVVDQHSFKGSNSFKISQKSNSIQAAEQMQYQQSINQLTPPVTISKSNLDDNQFFKYSPKSIDKFAEEQVQSQNQMRQSSFNNSAQGIKSQQSFSDNINNNNNNKNISNNINVQSNENLQNDDEQVNFSNDQLYGMMNQYNDEILPKKKLKHQEKSKERLKSAYQPTKPPMQQRAKSSQRPTTSTLRRIKNTTTPFDFKNASNPSFMQQDKAKERLARLAHSMSGGGGISSDGRARSRGNQSQNAESRESGGGQYNRTQIQDLRRIYGARSAFGSGKHDIKKVMKNHYMVSGGDSNDNDDDHSYDQDLDNDIEMLYTQNNNNQSLNESRYQSRIFQNDQQQLYDNGNY